MTVLSIVFPDISLCGQITQCHWPGAQRDTPAWLAAVLRRARETARDKRRSELALHNPLQGQ